MKQGAERQTRTKKSPNGKVKRSRRVGVESRMGENKKARFATTTKPLRPLLEGSHQQIGFSMFKIEKECQVVMSAKTDYSIMENYRELLNKLHVQGWLSCPVMALELSTLFIRCINTVGVGQSAAWERKKGMNTMARRFIANLIAALAWIYAFGYERQLPNNKSRLQQLSQLCCSEHSKVYTKAMELVQLLLACSYKKYRIEQSEVTSLQIGGWFNNRLAQSKKGVWNDNFLFGKESCKKNGLYLPFYTALRAIHPLCTPLEEVESIHLSEEEMQSLQSEPLLHVPASDNEGPRLFPRTTSSLGGKNYNLWFFYNHLQPEPSKRCETTELVAV